MSVETPPPSLSPPNSCTSADLNKTSWKFRYFDSLIDIATTFAQDTKSLCLYTFSCLVLHRFGLHKDISHVQYCYRKTKMSYCLLLHFSHLRLWERVFFFSDHDLTILNECTLGVPSFCGDGVSHSLAY